MFSDEMRHVRQNRDGQQVSFQSHAAVQELFVPEDRFYSKPEKKVRSLKECKVGGEEKGK